MNTIKCLHCGEQVVRATAYYGTYWTHAETWRPECRSTYAAPDFAPTPVLTTRQEREGGQ